MTNALASPQPEDLYFFFANADLHPAVGLFARLR
jgi:hypothetical protein